MVFSFTLTVWAQDFSSSNFTVTAPVLFPGGYSTSTNFSLTGVISQMAIGTSTATTFDLFGGFLYFPFVSTPTVTATAGNTQVALTWTTADASTGWAVSGYAVGQSTTAGGPYTYSDVGNVLASTRTSLTNGTPYYFVIRVTDALGFYIATSTEVSATPTAPAAGGGGGSSGGGGGGGASYTQTGIVFSGRAYPLSRVSILKDAQLAVTTIAGPDSKFKVNLSNLSPGNYLFSVYSEDSNQIRSNSFTFPVYITNGVVTEVGGIFIAPTVALDKSQVRKGDDIAIFGQTAVASDVTIQVNSEQQFFAQTKADANGIYLYNFDTTPLEYGNHSTKTKSAKDAEISPYSLAVPFVVGNTSILVKPREKVCDKRGDVNTDCRINLVDFSIAAYWYKRAAPPASIDLNKDGKVDLIDFSIMAFNWTG